jgi:hypothetical protein
MTSAKTKNSSTSSHLYITKHERQGKKQRKRREAGLQRRGGKADSGVHASKIWESRGGGRESRGGGRHTRRKGKYPTEAQTTGGRAAADGRWRRRLEAEQVRTVDGCSSDVRRCWSGSTAGADVRRCQAPRQGRQAGGLEQTSSQATSGARGSPATFSLPLPSPALVVNALRGRFPARKAQTSGRFSRASCFSRARDRFPAGLRSFWRPSPAN